MLRCLLAGCVLAAFATAQTTWSVGPAAPYQQIRDVMPLVADGDTVLVAPGSYVEFTCARGITLRAEVPGTVTVNFDYWLSLPPSCGCTCLSLPRNTSLSAPAGEQLDVVGIAFAGHWSLTPCWNAIAHFVAVTGGRVTFDECTIDALRVEQATVHLQDCVVQSSFVGAGMRATGASVTMVGGSVTGASVGPTIGANAPRPGVQLIGSSLHASSVAIGAGSGPGAAAGIELDVGSSLRLSDAVVVAQGACPVVGAGAIRIDRTVLTGGGVGCVTSPVGGPLTGIERNGPIATGSLFEVRTIGAPGDLHVFYGSTALAGPLLVPLVDGTIWIDPSELFFSLLAVAGPSGVSAFSYPVPAVPALVGSPFWLQSVGGAAFPLQISPVVGGLAR
ncbi:MAG: hypothetical protein KAI24_22985 [Planctomycetes bacterium]|nr:hypothetical protein [Planctomycetota bacterium]